MLFVRMKNLPCAILADARREWHAAAISDGSVFQNGYSPLAKIPVCRDRPLELQPQRWKAYEIGRRVVESSRSHDHHIEVDERTFTKPSQLSSEHVESPVLN
jgi:hypothetical protein